MRGGARSRHGVWIAAALATLCAQAQEPQPQLQLSTWLAQAPAPETPATAPEVSWTDSAAQWVPGNDACTALREPPWERLTLGDALTHILCQSPALRQALAEVAAQSAAVELGEVARNPTWNASVQYSTERNFNSSGTSGRTLGSSVGLTWALFDFGQRSANLREARLALSAAMATQGNTLLDGIREMLRLYGEAAVAAAALEASTETEASAARTAAAAQARYQAQVGSQIDRLQAQTALAQASLERVRAQSTWENARGALALALGGKVDQPLQMAQWTPWATGNEAVPDLSALQAEARQQHPRLRALRDQIASLDARMDASRAQNRGDVSLSASTGTSRNWGAAGQGNIPTGSVSLVASIPLFNGRQAQAQLAQIVAERSTREAELETAQREVDSQLWQAHQAMQTSRQNLQTTARLLASASKAFEVAQGRYRVGVGTMLELLNAQASLADARRQRVVAQMEQLTARTQLGLAAGRVGL